MAGSKVKSLEILDSLGFNTPNLLLRIPQFDDPHKKVEAWNNLKLPTSPEYPETRVSIRTQRDGEKKTPHYPNIREGEAEEKVRELAKAGYEILIFEAIDPKNCLLRGNLVRRSDRDAMILEWMEGPGTVRDLEKASKLLHLEILLFSQEENLTYSVNGIPEPIWPLVDHYFESPGLAHEILEWSYYNQPIGKLNQPTICWEFRGWR